MKNLIENEKSAIKKFTSAKWENFNLIMMEVGMGEEERGAIDAGDAINYSLHKT
jgi:hypothetical protein